MTGLMTMEQFQKVLPKKVKKSINPELLDKINTTMSDPVAMAEYRDNLLSYVSVMQDGRFKISQYLDAVRYVSHKLQGDPNIDAYIKTFPDRYSAFLKSNTTGKDIASYVTSYNKNKLVNLIYEQTLIPTHVLNADLYQKALNQQVWLMMNAKSEKVMSDAATSVMMQLRTPETTKIELDISVKEDSAIAELRETTLALAAQQRLMIQAGAMDAKEVAHSKILIEGEVVEESYE